MTEDRKYLTNEKTKYSLTTNLNFSVVSTEWQTAAQLVGSFGLCFVIKNAWESLGSTEGRQGGRKQITDISDHFLLLMFQRQQIEHQSPATQPKQTKKRGYFSYALWLQEAMPQRHKTQAL